MKPLEEPCLSAIEEGRCLGCNRLELDWWTGKDCKLEEKHGNTKETRSNL